MLRILFVCHGNICRSPMAEYIAKYLSKLHGIDKYLFISSKATSTEEIGNDIYPPIKKVLSKHKIPYDTHHASKLIKSDLNNYDLIIGMDSYNISNIKRILGDSDKIHKLCEYSNSTVDVDDPWYTREFEECFEEIYAHVNNMLKYLSKTVDFK